LAAPMMAASAAPVVANFRRVGFMVFSCARSTARKRRADIPVPREPRQETSQPGKPPPSGRSRKLHFGTGRASVR
jgi:hypothetical protein